MEGGGSQVDVVKDGELKVRAAETPMLNSR
jgi:hypothetical protein